MQTYPIIKYPGKIHAFFTGENPDIIKKLEPKKPHTRFAYLYVLYMSIAALALSFLFFSDNIIVSIGLFLISIYIFLAFLGSIQEYRLERKKDLLEYEHRKLSYEQTTKQQQELENKLKDKAARENYIVERVKEISSSAAKFEFEQFNIAAKGNSERFFYCELKKVFNDFVVIDVTIPNQQWRFPYIPDFVFSNGNITIDIEIDEPYSYNYSEPIHYFHTIKQKHIDEQRDDFFNDYSWTVVRFTERQVYCNSLGCCKTIAEIIYKVTNDDSFLLKLNNVKDIEPEIFWTKDQAKELANTNYRSTYTQTFKL